DYHLEFNCAITAGCIFEVDQTWLASGHTYPSNCTVPTNGLCVSQGTSVSAKGFAYIDDHGTYEFHPVASYTINTPLQLTTSFITSGTLQINTVVTFTSATSGGTSPYTISWSGAFTGSGATVTHTFTTTGTFTETETATDSASHTATSSASIVIVPVSTGTNFGTCTSLPQGWNCGNGSSGTATITGGVALVSMTNVGGGSNSYGYATTQKGTFPWSPCTAPASGAIPTGITSVSTTFTPT